MGSYTSFVGISINAISGMKKSSTIYNVEIISSKTQAYVCPYLIHTGLCEHIENELH